MSPLNPPLPRNSSRRCRTVRAFTACVLMAVLFAAKSVQAEPVRIHQVVQTLSSYQGPVDLRLGGVATQDPSGNSKPASTNGQRNDGPVDALVVAPDGLGLPVVQDPQKLGVEIVEEAEVEGTICDCGEMFIPGGAFPKWPLLFLTAVPFVFIDKNCDDCDETPISTPTPTPPPPTPTPTPTPEPASLLLFGTGLLAAGAGLRRRYSKAKGTDKAKAAAGEE